MQTRPDASGGDDNRRLLYDRSPMPGRQIDWTAQDWEDLVPRLLLLAVSRLSRMTWRGRRQGPTPGAAQPEDFVNDAIAKTMAGIRAWDPERCTLFQHLAGAIVSDISHAAESFENRITLSATGAPSDSDWPPDHADDDPDPEQAAMWQSEQRRLIAHLEGLDPLLGRMAKHMLIEDCRETADLCLALDLAPSDIANLRKRLKRAVRAYIVEHGE